MHARVDHLVVHRFPHAQVLGFPLPQRTLPFLSLLTVATCLYCRPSPRNRRCNWRPDRWGAVPRAQAPGRIFNADMIAAHRARTRPPPLGLTHEAPSVHLLNRPIAWNRARSASP